MSDIDDELRYSVRVTPVNAPVYKTRAPMRGTSDALYNLEPVWMTLAEATAAYHDYKEHAELEQFWHRYVVEIVPKPTEGAAK